MLLSVTPDGNGAKTVHFQTSPANEPAPPALRSACSVWAKQGKPAKQYWPVLSVKVSNCAVNGLIALGVEKSNSDWSVVFRWKFLFPSASVRTRGPTSS